MVVEYSELQAVGYKNPSGLESIFPLLAIFACPLPLIILSAVIKSFRKNTKCVCFYGPTLAVVEEFQMPKPQVASHETTTSAWITLVLEFCVIVIPTTILFSAPPTSIPFGLPVTVTLIVLVLVVLYACMFPSKAKDAQSKEKVEDVEEHDEKFEIVQLSKLDNHCQVTLHSSRMSFIAYYRGFLTFIIAVVILAVDFGCFPRAFAKTETYGISLMDFGVGGVIFMSGVVSNTAWIKVRGMPRIRNLGDIFVRIYRSNAIKVILLGFARSISVWGVSYHVPTDEYGVHWNFFFTIAFVNLICTRLEPLFANFCKLKLIPTAWSLTGFVICIAGVMEYWHSSNLIPMTNLFPSGESSVQESKVQTVWQWMFFGARMDIVSANKEGIFSLPGYCCLRLLGTAVGCFVNSCNGVSNRIETARPRLLLFVLVILATVSLSISTNCFGFEGESFPFVMAHPSRRLCNFAYIILTAGLNVFLMVAFLMGTFVERLLIATTIRIAKDKPTSLEMTGMSKIIIAWQKAPLVLFLLANVQTGLINLCPGLEPLRRPAWVGVCVCCAHACVLSAVAVGLCKYRLF